MQSREIDLNVCVPTHPLTRSPVPENIVKATLEVKTTLRKDHVDEADTALGSVKTRTDLRESKQEMDTILFGFQATDKDKPIGRQTVMKWMQTVSRLCLHICSHQPLQNHNIDYVFVPASTKSFAFVNVRARSKLGQYIARAIATAVPHDTTDPSTGQLTSEHWLCLEPQSNDGCIIGSLQFALALSAGCADKYTALGEFLTRQQWTPRKVQLFSKSYAV